MNTYITKKYKSGKQKENDNYYKLGRTETGFSTT